MIIRVDSSFHICLLHFKTFASKIFLSLFMYILNTNGVFTRHYETNWSETYAKQHNWNIKLYEANYVFSPLENKTECTFFHLHRLMLEMTQFYDLFNLLFYNNFFLTLSYRLVHFQLINARSDSFTLSINQFQVLLLKSCCQKSSLCKVRLRFLQWLISLETD